MGDWKTTLLLASFLVQAVLGLVFYGIPAIMFSKVLPEFFYLELAWSLKLFILGYFLTALLSLYYLGVSPRLETGRLFGTVYFAFGMLGSVWVIVESISSAETPLLFVAFGIWFATSLCGIIALWLAGERIPEAAAAAVMALLGVSALISTLIAEWVAVDYYVHASMKGGPENATVVVGLVGCLSISRTRAEPSLLRHA
ncbi:hypothetical protein [Thermococcus thermotolerans]|uniref:hypothetical protein n=1 Tax=Thermococcus thermotolerans TaxID=2969672 RepID=UPI002157AA97|nr:hypothetical protein [Thermococcus thermotolerans]